MLIETAITTAPRKKATIKKTIISLRRAGFNERIHIFSEPQAADPNQPNSIRHVNNERLGLIGNFKYALQWMLDNTKGDYILMSQDDALYSRTSYDKLARFLEEKRRIGYVSLYLSNHDKRLGVNKRSGFYPHKIGFDPCFWGAVSLLFTRHSAGLLLNNEKFKLFKQDEKSDCMIGQCMLEMKQNMWYAVPSLVDHIGINSTMGHRPLQEHKGYKFGS